MEGWTRLCRLDEVPEGRGLTVDAAGTRLAVLREGDSIAVTFDRCPHAGGSLGAGRVAEGEVVCPRHRWRFRLRDGRCDVPGYSAHLIECRVLEGEVWGRIGAD